MYGTYNKQQQQHTCTCTCICTHVHVHVVRARVCRGRPRQDSREWPPVPPRDTGETGTGGSGKGGVSGGAVVLLRTRETVRPRHLSGAPHVTLGPHDTLPHTRSSRLRRGAVSVENPRPACRRSSLRHQPRRHRALPILGLAERRGGVAVPPPAWPTRRAPRRVLEHHRACLCVARRVDFDRAAVVGAGELRRESVRAVAAAHGHTAEG
jgi:hypothetical protein